MFRSSLAQKSGGLSFDTETLKEHKENAIHVQQLQRVPDMQYMQQLFPQLKTRKLDEFIERIQKGREQILQQFPTKKGMIDSAKLSDEKKSIATSAFVSL